MRDVDVEALTSRVVRPCTVVSLSVVKDWTVGWVPSVSCVTSAVAEVPSSVDISDGVVGINVEVHSVDDNDGDDVVVITASWRHLSPVNLGGHRHVTCATRLFVEGFEKHVPPFAHISLGAWSQAGSVK